MRKLYLTLAAAFAVVAVGAAIVHRTPPVIATAAGSDSVTVPDSPRPSTTEATTTSTTVDPAAIEAFLAEWQRAELAAATTTTTAPPPPPPTTTTTVYVPPPTTVYVPPEPEPAPEPQVVEEPAYGGGCVIPLYICQRESGMSYTALNPSSGAGGMYQFMPSTWNAIARAIAPEWIGTPPHTAPPWVQDMFATYLWDGGRGCAHWSAC